MGTTGRPELKWWYGWRINHPCLFGLGSAFFLLFILAVAALPIGGISGNPAFAVGLSAAFGVAQTIRARRDRRDEVAHQAG